jgi:hypothetical protein
MRTWEENKETINQFWSHNDFTPEEAKLWEDDLKALDQEVLYLSIRNVKRTRDTLWVHLKWVKDEYRDLMNAQKRVVSSVERREKLNLTIDESESRRLADDFVRVIKSASPSDFKTIETSVLDKLTKMASKHAIEVLKYARLVLLGQGPRFGRVDDGGDVTPF